MAAKAPLHVPSEEVVNAYREGISELLEKLLPEPFNRAFDAYLRTDQLPVTWVAEDIAVMARAYEDLVLLKQDQAKGGK